jgi:hypothetical protein
MLQFQLHLILFESLNLAFQIFIFLFKGLNRFSISEQVGCMLLQKLECIQDSLHALVLHYKDKCKHIKVYKGRQPTQGTLLQMTSFCLDSPEYEVEKSRSCRYH